MLSAYLITLIVGGVLVAISLVVGGDGDGGGHDGDAHAGDADGDAHAEHGGAFDAALGWLPLGSLRFWTFFAAFFGLTGTALSLLPGTGSIVTAVAAVATGYGAGVALTRIVRRLQQTSSDSSLAAADLIGATAHVLLPVAPGRAGKVRLHLKGRAVDLLAETQEEAELPAGEKALVIAAPDQGHVVIARIDKLT
jgi:membrane protein implicated in regulation of membrane protease activity